MKEHRNISIADQIFDQLEKDILSGKYERGEVLSELRLSKELNVSRTPIREALLRLEQENVLRETGRGMEVIGISGEDMLDMYDIRMHLEGPSARRAAENITDEQLAALLYQQAGEQPLGAHQESGQPVSRTALSVQRQ